MKRLLCGVMLLAMAGAALAALSPDEQSGYQKMLAVVDAQVSFMDSDFSATYTIVKSSPGEGTSTTVAALFRRDKDNKYLMLILKPDVERGKGYLKIDNNLWLYDPVAKRTNPTSAKDRFQNSNARNSDFTRSNLAGDYRVQSAGQQKLGKFDCTVLELKAIGDGVTFPWMKIWISADNLVRKYEDYSLSRQLMRTTMIPSYQKVGTRYVPVSILIKDALKGKKVDGKFVSEETQITIDGPVTDKLADKLFTNDYLMGMAK